MYKKLALENYTKMFVEQFANEFSLECLEIV